MAKESRELPVKISEATAQVKGQSLAEIETEIAKLEDEKAKYNKKMKGEIDSRRTIAARLASEIVDRAELRFVECDWRMVKNRKVKELIRLDTREVVETRELSGSDLQTNLVDQSEGNGGKKKPKAKKD